MKILCACEESQAVCVAFRELGHEAFSCDIQECSGGHPEWHICDDVLNVLHLYWDLLIGFPPCTYLSNAGANRLRINGVIQEDRMAKARAAKEFFLSLYNADVPRIAIENPTPGSIHGLPPYSQVIEPYMFGDPWKKRTCLWLKNLPILLATDVCVPTGLWVHASNSRDPLFANRGVTSAFMRSKTFPGVARAMALQWGCLNG